MHFVLLLDITPWCNKKCTKKLRLRLLIYIWPRRCSLYLFCYWWRNIPQKVLIPCANKIYQNMTNCVNSSYIQLIICTAVYLEKVLCTKSVHQRWIWCSGLMCALCTYIVQACLYKNSASMLQWYALECTSHYCLTRWCVQYAYYTIHSSLSTSIV